MDAVVLANEAILGSAMATFTAALVAAEQSTLTTAALTSPTILGDIIAMLLVQFPQFTQAQAVQIGTNIWSTAIANSQTTGQPIHGTPMYDATFTHTNSANIAGIMTTVATQAYNNALPFTWPQ